MTKDIESMFDQDAHSGGLRCDDDQRWAAAEDARYYNAEPPDPLATVLAFVHISRADLESGVSEVVSGWYS
jgi:hypothetical protein